MEPMIDSIKLRWHWIIFVVKWLLLRKIICIALLLLVGAIFLSWLMPLPYKTSADRLRYTGLALELFGIFTVAYGIFETLKSFGRNLRSIISEPFKGFPKFDDTNNVIGNIQLGGFDFNLSSQVTYTPPEDMPIEDQVKEMWPILNRTSVLASKNEHELELEKKNWSVAFNNERSAREASIEEVRVALEKPAVEGKAIEAIGIVCLVLGAIFATASTELASLFDSFPALLMALNIEYLNPTHAEASSPLSQ